MRRASSSTALRARTTAGFFGEALGLEIDYYVMINLDGFKDLIDALGGITVNVNYRIPIGGKTTENVPPKGWIEPGANKHLDGRLALWYARGRYHVKGSDYSRMERQRCVINAVVQQTTPLDVLQNYQSIAAAGEKTITTDVPRSLLPAGKRPAHPLPDPSDWTFELIERYHAAIAATAERFGVSASKKRSMQQQLAAGRVDYTIFWRRLSRAVADGKDEPVRDLFADRTAFDAWSLQYKELLALDDKAMAADLMLKTNPCFVLRNHLAEQAIRAAKLGDLSVLQTLQRLLARPFDEHPGFEAYADFPPDWASSLSISCSS